MKVNNNIIRSWGPCYNPEFAPEDESLEVLDWIEKYREVVPTNILKKKMKYVVCRFNCQIGEFEFTETYTFGTTAKDICFSAQREAAKFWGCDGERDGDGWSFQNGEIYVELAKVVELTPEEYSFLGKILYG